MKMKLIMVACFLSAFITMSSAGLQDNFYASSCPNAEKIVTNAVYAMIDANPALAAGLIRLHFHDCFVKGCDGSILLDPTSANSSPGPEKKAIPLAESGYVAINKIKAELEKACPGKVSCADIVAFAARDAVAKNANFVYSVQSGRRDGTVSSFFDVLTNMPSAFFTFKDLNASFARKKLDMDDLVALSAAHAIGKAHCSGVTRRLYPTVDPTLDATYAAALKIKCPENGPDNMVDNNPVAGTALGNQFYKNAQAKKVLFTSDATLLTNSYTAAKVAEYADDANLTKWMVRFAASMIKMGGIEVLTGTQGEIRKFCNVVNS